MYELRVSQTLTSFCLFFFFKKIFTYQEPTNPLELLSLLAMQELSTNDNNNNNIEEESEVKILDASEVDVSPTKAPPSSPVDWSTPTCYAGTTQDGCVDDPCNCLAELDSLEEPDLKIEEEEEEAEGETGTGGGNPVWHHSVFGQWISGIPTADSSVENGEVGSAQPPPSLPARGEGLLQTVDLSTLLYGMDIQQQQQQQIPSPPVSKPKPPSRHSFSRAERDMLEITFENSTYPSTATQKELASKLCLPKKKIRTWFQNRRSTIARLKQKHIKHNAGVLKQLESAFAESHLPSHHVKQSLMGKTFMTMEEIDHWFAVRRDNWNKACQDVSQVLQNNHEQSQVQQVQNNSMIMQWKHHQQQQQERLALALNASTNRPTTTAVNPRPTVEYHYQTSSQLPPHYKPTVRPGPRVPATAELRYQTVLPPTIRPVASTVPRVLPSAWGGNHPVYYCPPNYYSPFANNL